MADTQHKIICPACDTEMQKVYIENANVNIDICTNGCGGMFFDNRELEKFDEKHENADEILNAVAGKEFKPTKDQEVRICPVCNIPMVKMGAGNNVKIDVCNACGAKFLDNGELQKIREASDKESGISEKEQAILNYLELKTLDSTLRSAGKFVNTYIPATPARKALTGFISKFISNL